MARGWESHTWNCVRPCCLIDGLEHRGNMEKRAAAEYLIAIAAALETLVEGLLLQVNGLDNEYCDTYA
jgi:hypothetical protein